MASGNVQSQEVGVLKPQEILLQFSLFLPSFFFRYIWKENKEAFSTQADRALYTPLPSCPSLGMQIISDLSGPNLT